MSVSQSEANIAAGSDAPEENNPQRPAGNNPPGNNPVPNNPVYARSIWAPEIPRSNVQSNDGMSTSERIRSAKFGN